MSKRRLGFWTCANLWNFWIFWKKRVTTLSAAVIALMIQVGALSLYVNTLEDCISSGGVGCNPQVLNTIQRDWNEADDDIDKIVRQIKISKSIRKDKDFNNYVDLYQREVVRVAESVDVINKTIVTPQFAAARKSATPSQKA